MTPDQWLAAAGVAAAWTGSVGGFFYWLDIKKTRALDDIRTEITMVAARASEEHRGLREKMISEHDEIHDTIKDMAKTIKDEFVHRREFDISIRNLEGGLTEARKEIGAVGVQVGEVHQRIDRWIERRSS